MVKGNARATSSWLQLQEAFGDRSSGLGVGPSLAAGLDLSKLPFTPSRGLDSDICGPPAL